MRDFFQQWRTALDTLPFDSYGVEDRIDFVMLRNQIDFELRELAAQDKRLREAAPLVPFAPPLTALAEARRMMQPQDGPSAAALLQQSLASVRQAQEALLAAEATSIRPSRSPRAAWPTADRADHAALARPGRNGTPITKGSIRP
ncbi:hypothetical protein LP419_17155 [Massilia sp. H-1]|nr:hypothetical protein LP419_17155 [Massilia sp. H-1]